MAAHFPNTTTCHDGSMALCLVLCSFASACLAAADMLPAHEEECIVDIVWTISHWGVPLWWLEDAAGAEGAAARVAAPQEVPAAGAGEEAVSLAAAEDAASAEATSPPAEAAAAAAYPYGSPRPMSLIARKLVRQLQQPQLAPDTAAEVGGTKLGCMHGHLLGVLVEKVGLMQDYEVSTARCHHPQLPCALHWSLSCQACPWRPFLM